MSFIAKNPLIIPEIETAPSPPQPGTRALFAKKDGWYEIDSNNKTRKVTNDNNGGSSDSTVTPVYSYVNILGGADNWIAENVTDDSGNIIGSRYGQVVYDYNNKIFNIDNAVITPNSKVDLQITSEQMVVFYEKSLAFVAENDDGVITVYCVGTIPQNNYTMQAVITEVATN